MSFLSFFYKNPGNSYSKENVMVEEENGKIRGLLLAYPASNIKRFGKNMLKHIKGMVRISGFYKMVKEIEEN